jgi:hypothetical protein
VPKVWYGLRAQGRIGFTGGDTRTAEAEMFFSSPTFNNGDKVLRTLFSWQLETELLSSSDALQNMMWPAFVCLTYHPDPDGDVEASASAAGGAALWREQVTWNRSNYTDGTLYAVKYVAGSYGMRSGQGTRDIHDTDTAKLIMSVSFPDGMAGQDNTLLLAPETNWVMAVEVLVQQ